MCFRAAICTAVDKLSTDIVRRAVHAIAELLLSETEASIVFVDQQLDSHRAGNARFSRRRRSNSFMQSQLASWILDGGLA